MTSKRMERLDTSGLSSPIQVPGFGMTENSAIRFGLTDPISSLRALSRVRRILVWFGFLHTVNTLADPRLEALRRFVLALRIGKSAVLQSARDELARYSFGAAEVSAIRLALQA
jgi:hypothetical protein